MSIDTSQRVKPRFVPRQYPMLSLLVTVFQVFAGLFVASGLACLVAIVVMAQNVPPELRESMIVVFAIYFGATVLGHGAGCAWFLLVAEAVKLMLDIQRNTQETAFLSRHS